MSCGKIAFKTKEEANEKAFAINNRPHNKKVAKVYRCSECNMFHTTPRGLNGSKISKMKKQSGSKVIKFRL